MTLASESPALTNLEIIPANYFVPLDLGAIYGRKAPLEVDLGCGDGLFLADIAAANPAHDFLGIERLVGRLRTAHRKIVARRLTNARLLRIETSYAVHQMLPATSVSVFHLLFPDPWPKRRHWPRRIVTPDFLASVERALIPRGLLRIATDDAVYFREIERLVRQTSEFTRISNPAPPMFPTTFEKKFCESKIHRLVIRKISDVR